MLAEDLKAIVLDIVKLKTETQTIELKAAVKGCPTRRTCIDLYRCS